MNGRSLGSVHASNFARSWESSRPLRSDPGASYSVRFLDRQPHTASAADSEPARAFAVDSRDRRTLTHSVQAATILTPTGLPFP
jgi:hypothetical protein